MVNEKPEWEVRAKERDLWEQMYALEDRTVSLLLLGVPLPEHFHDSVNNRRLRYALQEGGDYFEPRIIHNLIRGASVMPLVRTALEAIEATGRIRKTYHIYSRKTGNLLLRSGVAPDFKDGEWRTNTSNGRKRYEQEKVNVEINWQMTKKFRDRIGYVR